MNGVKKFDTEGLNSLKYDVRSFERKILYTWILAEIKQDSVCTIYFGNFFFFCFFKCLFQYSQM